MNGLPLHLLDDILFRLDPKYMAMMRCTNRSINSHISEDPNFEIGYSSRVRPSLLNLNTYGSSYVYCQPFVFTCDPLSLGKRAHLFKHRCYILGSCSGLLLLYINGLFVANPLTKRFRLLDHSGSKLLPMVVGGDNLLYKDGSYPEGNIARTERAMCIGFAVNRNGTTKRFKIICILEMKMMYEFEIFDGESWRLSKTTIANISESDLVKRMKPVYLHDTLHWLRNDGSIITFNPETEQARFIPSIFHREPDTKLLFASDNKMNCLTLISGTREEISVYTLTGNTKWVLNRQIKNVSMEISELQLWNVVMYDGKLLVVRTKKIHVLDSVVHVYDMEANTGWRDLGLAYVWARGDIDFHKFTPSLSFVEEDDEQNKNIVASNELRISYLTKVMGLVDITM